MHRAPMEAQLIAESVEEGVPSQGEVCVGEVGEVRGEKREKAFKKARYSQRQSR
jgi:hypothetical protein